MLYSIVLICFIHYIILILHYFIFFYIAILFSLMKSKKYTIKLNPSTHRQLSMLKLYLLEKKDNATLNDAIIMSIQETYLKLEKQGYFKEEL